MKVLRVVGFIFLWCLIGLLTVWALAALYVDVRIPALRIPALVTYFLALIAIFWFVRGPLRMAALCLALFCVVLLWWLSLKPTGKSDWQADVSRTPWAEIDGDRVTIHNLRNCEYRSETDYSNCWTERTVYLSRLRGVDLFLTNWGIPYISHPILSFQFGDNDHVAFSIEARYKVGQSYSAVLGFFRQYELIIVAADERDVIRLRTNFRKDEEVYLYRAQLPLETAREIFMIYVNYLNRLNDHPEWYNALTKNCTTAVDRQISAKLANPNPWNYQILVNGTLDELLYNRGRLVTDGLPFPELKQREHINAAARSAGDSPNYSELIRIGRVGFEDPTKSSARASGKAEISAAKNRSSQ